MNTGYSHALYQTLEEIHMSHSCLKLYESKIITNPWGPTIFKRKGGLGLLLILYCSCKFSEHAAQFEHNSCKITVKMNFWRPFCMLSTSHILHKKKSSYRPFFLFLCQKQSNIPSKTNPAYGTSAKKKKNTPKLPKLPGVQWPWAPSSKVRLHLCNAVKCAMVDGNV